MAKPRSQKAKNSKPKAGTEVFNTPPKNKKINKKNSSKENDINSPAKNTRNTPVKSPAKRSKAVAVTPPPVKKATKRTIRKPAVFDSDAPTVISPKKRLIKPPPSIKDLIGKGKAHTKSGVKFKKTHVSDDDEDESSPSEKGKINLKFISKIHLG